MQCDLSGEESLPGAQSLHSEAPTWVLNLPLAQSTQSRGQGAPPSYAWNLPMLHRIQACPSKYWPAAQAAVGAGEGAGVGKRDGTDDGRGDGRGAGAELGAGVG